MRCVNLQGTEILRFVEQKWSIFVLRIKIVYL